jgi:hypothetical protein
LKEGKDGLSYKLLEASYHNSDVSSNNNDIKEEVGSASRGGTVRSAAERWYPTVTQDSQDGGRGLILINNTSLEQNKLETTASSKRN